MVLPLLFRLCATEKLKEESRIDLIVSGNVANLLGSILVDK